MENKNVNQNPVNDILNNKDLCLKIAVKIIEEHILDITKAADFLEEYTPSFDETIKEIHQAVGELNFAISLIKPNE